MNTKIYYPQIKFAVISTQKIADRYYNQSINIPPEYT